MQDVVARRRRVVHPDAGRQLLCLVTREYLGGDVESEHVVFDLDDRDRAFGCFVGINISAHPLNICSLIRENELGGLTSLGLAGRSSLL